MKKITLSELINNYSKVDDEFPLGVTILNNDSNNTVVKIFTSRNVPEEFKNRIVKVYNMSALNSRATAFEIKVKLK